MDVPARRVLCVLGARHAAVSKGAGARRSSNEIRKGSLPDPRNAAQRGSAKSAPHGARDHAARLSGIEGVEAELVAPPVQGIFPTTARALFSSLVLSTKPKYRVLPLPLAPADKYGSREE